MAFEQSIPGPSVSPYISSSATGVAYPHQYPTRAQTQSQLQTPTRPPAQRASTRSAIAGTSVQAYAQPRQGYSQGSIAGGQSRVRPPSLPQPSINGRLQPNGTSDSPHVISQSISTSHIQNRNPDRAEEGNPSSGTTEKSDIPPSTFPYYSQPINIGFTQLANGHGLHHSSLHRMNGQEQGVGPRYAAVGGTANGAGAGMAYEVGQGNEVPGIGVGTYFGRGEGWLDSDGYNFHPLYQPGAGVEAMSLFTASLDGMVGGDQDDWSGLIETHFDEDARVQLTLTSNRSPSLRLFDISAMALTRILTSWTSQLHSSTLSLRHHVETPLWSPPQSPNTDLPYNNFPRHGIQVESEGEWKFIYNHPVKTARNVEVVWKIMSKSDWVGVMDEGVLKMEMWDVLVEEWVSDGQDSRVGDQVETMDIDGKEQGGVSNIGGGDEGEVVGEWGIPRKVVRELEITQQIEEVFEVLGPTQNQSEARAILDSLVKDEE